MRENEWSMGGRRRRKGPARRKDSAICMFNTLLDND